MPSVERGDVCIVAYSGKAEAIGNTGEFMLGNHAFMISQPGELNPDSPTVHLTWGGLEFLPYGGHGGDTDKFTIFRCKGGRGALACNHAVGWTNKSAAKNGHYSHERSKAVAHDLKHLGNLPYEFDALRRSIKWARKQDKDFSTNKGLTCAAYIVACYQASAFASLGFDKLEMAWQKLEELRVDKKHFRSLQPGGNPAYRESANPGATGSGVDSSADAMAQVVKALDPEAKDPVQFLSDLLSPGMLTDARFIATDGLMRRLSSERSGWIKVHEQLPRLVVAKPTVAVRATPTVGVNPPFAGNQRVTRGVNPLYGGQRPAALGGDNNATASDDDPFGDVKLETW